MFTTIQDGGRSGLAFYAIPGSGPLDGAAARLANVLVGNDYDQPVLECNFTGPHIVFTQSAVISLTGADMQWAVNGQPVDRHTTLSIPEGGRLSGRNSNNGVRAYIAIQGKWQLPKMLDSSSTYVPAKLGGLNGLPLQAGDQLHITQSTTKATPEISIQQSTQYEKINRIGFYRGPEWKRLDISSQELFTTNEYTILPTSNRIGAKLSAAPLRAKDVGLIPSSGVFPGVIQLPGEGMPIVLLNDCPTTGGYPRIGVVPEEELWRFSQIRPGRTFRFFDIQA